MSNIPLSPPMDAERPILPASVTGSSGYPVEWLQGVPTLRMDPAVVETVVTRTTRTTTSFAPIRLPRIPSPERLTLPSHLPSESYPLASQTIPDDMRRFSVKIGGHRVVIQDEASSSLSSHAETSRSAAMHGWRRDSPEASADEGEVIEKMDVLQGMRRFKGKEARKRPHQSPGSAAHERALTPNRSPPSTTALVGSQAPPRKRIRGHDEVNMSGPSALLSPLPSPESQTPPGLSPIGAALPLNTGHEMAALYSLPSLVSHFDGLPDKIQQHVLMQLMRRSRMSTIQRVTAFASTALRRDFISCLPHELAVQVLQSVDTKTLARSTRVSRKWKRMIDSERSVWKQRLIDDDMYHGSGVEEEEEALVSRRMEILEEQARLSPFKADTPDEDFGDDDDASMSGSRASRKPPSATPAADRPVPLKHVYRRRHQSNHNWFHKRPTHNSFPGHGTNVVTCLQFDRERIVSASDDHSINVYKIATGQLAKRLDGHEGGVWALQYLGDSLVSGSTDRTLRIWDLDKLVQTHVFYGHTSTVRCLQIVEPVYDAESGEYYPPYPYVVTGSRDYTLRVWKLPKKGEPAKQNWVEGEDGELIEAPVLPEDNPFHVHHLTGHRSAIRALAAYGRYCVSGSYDHTVRVWDIVKGTQLHELKGHNNKVYSIVYDRHRHRCASGSMDNTVKVWDLHTGDCLHTLMGHTSLVGLLGLSPNFLVSAAADSSLRVWNSRDAAIKQILANNGGAITCFQHDEHKVVSGSDGMLKLWDIRKGTFVRDLVIGISSVWQVSFSGNLLVAASNRSGHTVFDVFDFGQLDHISGVDDDRLDKLRRPPWERDNPMEPRAYQSDDFDIESGYRWGEIEAANPANKRHDPFTRRERLAQWERHSTRRPHIHQPFHQHQSDGERRSRRLAQKVAEGSSVSPTPVAGPSRPRASTSRPSRSTAPAARHHHHHHLRHVGVTPTPQHPMIHQGRVTRSRSGPGLVQTQSPSPARLQSGRTGSTGQLGHLALNDQRSYAPVFDDDDHPPPRLRTRDLDNLDTLESISGDSDFLSDLSDRHGDDRSSMNHDLSEGELGVQGATMMDDIDD